MASIIGYGARRAPGDRRSGSRRGEAPRRGEGVEVALGRRLPGLRLVPGEPIAYRRSLVGRGLTSLRGEW
ncbi:hypothetical protein [Nonomuraea sp. NPDC048916]|uniref:hypothetical protein n=1 Tax=Nonomuraea sp. NPDC048916 TaxID=3154232 RepID=UPI0033D062EE